MGGPAGTGLDGPSREVARRKECGGLSGYPTGVKDSFFGAKSGPNSAGNAARLLTHICRPAGLPPEPGATAETDQEE